MYKRDNTSSAAYQNVKYDWILAQCKQLRECGNEN